MLLDENAKKGQNNNSFRKWENADERNSANNLIQFWNRTHVGINMFSQSFHFEMTSLI